jgi:MFS family permease
VADGDLGGSSLQIALVQTAATLPVFLLVVPAGALGDVVDRRRLLLLSQTLMVLAAAALAALAAARAVTPDRLLGLTAVLGVGQALATPSFQAIQPELVAREELPQAALLNGANGNVARAVGPAIGGLLIAGAGPAGAFALNAASFVGVLAVLHRWSRPPTERPLGAEPILQAIRAGLRYVRADPAFSSVLARSALVMVFASGMWALLPALARGPLRLGPNGYGALLAAVGAGAVLGIAVLPRLRARGGADGVVTGATLTYAAAVVVVGLSSSPAVTTAALVVAGLAWIAVLSTLGATAQLLLPTWARARALAYFQLVFMGGQALGALAWGAVADRFGLAAAFLAPAGGLVLAAFLGLLLPLRSDADVRRSSPPWPQPPPSLERAPDAGPVLVTLEWQVRGSDVSEFLAAMRQLGRARRRTGAYLWGCSRTPTTPSCSWRPSPSAPGTSTSASTSSGARWPTRCWRSGPAACSSRAPARSSATSSGRTRSRRRSRTASPPCSRTPSPSRPRPPRLRRATREDRAPTRCGGATRGGPNIGRSAECTRSAPGNHWTALLFTSRGRIVSTGSVSRGTRGAVVPRIHKPVTGPAADQAGAATSIPFRTGRDGQQNLDRRKSCHASDCWAPMAG